jgi:methylmalonyl-CoA mutase N-terminal domain/subunit
VVGLNKFTLDQEEPFELLRADPQIEADQCERLGALRTDRDNDAVMRALDLVRITAGGTDNLLLPMKEALAAHATGGEVAHALRDVWGTYVPNDAF